jgi:PAS domain S-box-containing protein
MLLPEGLPDNVEKTFDLVLHLCQRLGYEQAMLALVDAEARLIRAVKAVGTMAEIVAQTVRALDGDDILAIAARDGRSVVIRDAALNPHCDQTARAAANVRGMIVLPLVNEGNVVGTLQVASRLPLDPQPNDLKTLETLAGQAARALAGLLALHEVRRLNQQLEERNQQLQGLADDLAAAAQAERQAREEQARSEAALHAQKRLLQSILDNMSEGVVVADSAGKFLLFNPAAEAILGVGMTDARPEAWSDRYSVFLPDATTRHPPDELPLARAIRGESVDDAEVVIRRADKPTGLDISVNARPIRDERGALTGGVVVFRDVTERNRASAALRASEEQIRLLLHSSGEGIYGIDLQGRCTLLNRAGAEMIGCSIDEALGRNMHDFIHHSRNDGSPYPVEQCPIYNAFRTGTRCRIDHEVFWRRDGSPFPVEYSSHPLVVAGEVRGAVVTFTDISQRKEAEERLCIQNERLQEMARSEHQAHEELKKAQGHLVQSEKLVALGQLVAGVAHEINNPLSFVINNVAVLQRDAAALRALLALYREAEEVLKEHRPELTARIDAFAGRIDLAYTLENLDGLTTRSRDGLKRIQAIVKDLRDFARLDESDLHEVDLNPGIESTINIVQGQAKKQQVELALDLAPLPRVTCYPAKVNQVILNLVTNGIDACPPGGKVTVRTQPNEAGVEIAVADTGCGIDPRVRDRIFDPFFTTKPQGKGTGLGLSISYGIVEAHGGTIAVDSTVGKGTCFRVHLPCRPIHATERSA